MTKRRAAECPDLETIAAYIDGTLPKRERARVTEHIASCEECYTLFVESAQTPAPEAIAPSPARGWMRAGRLKLLGGAAAVLATAASLWLVVGGTLLNRSSDLQMLVAAVGTDRIIEARLTGGFAYGQLRGPVRGAAGAPSQISADVRLAAAQTEKAFAGASSPAALHAVGVASLTLGDLDRAIPTMERAVEQAPNARYLNDLSAAYLARAARDHHHQDLMKALTAADRAVSANPGLLEALFNRALALEGLSLRDEARTAWEDYLRADDHTGWADEARAHLRMLQ